MKESEVVKIIENYTGYVDRSRTDQCLHEVNFNLVAKDITKKLRETLNDFVGWWNDKQISSDRINYNEFLFYTLLQDVKNNKHPLTNLEYDYAFNLIPKYYNHFFLSNYNDENLSEYDAIINYLKNY